MILVLNKIKNYYFVLDSGYNMVKYKPNNNPSTSAYYESQPDNEANTYVELAPRANSTMAENSSNTFKVCI